ncbi:2-polyprenyl-3-methyl-5-hydroxy-6-metoxy-1,4-benzoquinol methylase [Bradyrhizobium sp. USDA 372]
MKPFNVHTEALLRAALPSPSLILDVGCGHGEIAFWLAENGGHTVYGIDPRLPLPQGCWHSVTDLSGGEVNLLNGTIRSLKPAHGFDCVLGLGLLHSLGSRDDVDFVLRYMCACGRPGARLALSWLVATRSLQSRHSEAYHPPTEEVFSSMNEFGGTLQYKLEAELVHYDGGLHSHQATYALWQM